MGEALWSTLSIIALLIVIACIPLGFVQADGRVILQIGVSIVSAVMIIVLWEVVKESFKQ